jgi:hypothetical protein
MAEDINPVLRAELNEALAVLAPQIRGLHDFAVPVSISPDLLVSVNAQITFRENRRDLIQAALDCLDATQAALSALESDGYPELPQAAIIASQFEELQEESADLDAAASVFIEQAGRVTVVLGAPAPKPPAE